VGFKNLALPIGEDVGSHGFTILGNHKKLLPHNACARDRNRNPQEAKLIPLRFKGLP
jgi:hypothetical protein